MADDITEILEDGFKELSTENDWCPEFTLKRLGQIDTTRQAIKNRFDELMTDLDKEKAHLLSYYKDVVQHETDKLLDAQRGKKKSVKFLTGTAGYRSSKGRFVITDLTKAKLWAYNNLAPEAFEAAVSAVDLERTKKNLSPVELYDVATKLNTGPLRDVMEKTGEMADGCEMVGGGETFYLKPATLKLQEGTE